MTVLQLEGESAQLRQVARLHANGDITLDDYRNIRTVMIDAFVADLGAGAMGADANATDASATLIGVEVQIPDHLPGSHHGGLHAAEAASESFMALLAILGAGAMLLLVAMLAIGLGT